MHEELFWGKARLPERRWPEAEHVFHTNAGRKAMQLALVDAVLREVMPAVLESHGHPAAAALRRLGRVTTSEAAVRASEVWQRESGKAPLPFGLGALRTALLEAAAGEMRLSTPAPFGLTCLRLERLGDDVSDALGAALDRALQRWLDDTSGA